MFTNFFVSSPRDESYREGWDIGVPPTLPVNDVGLDREDRAEDAEVASSAREGAKGKRFGEGLALCFVWLRFWCSGAFPIEVRRSHARLHGSCEKGLPRTGGGSVDGPDRIDRGAAVRFEARTHDTELGTKFFAPARIILARTCLNVLSRFPETTVT